ncbi:polygalacturonase-like [Cylas formicarius]|uniref:polygalacturonase-like n=1 Tax=Cylas formicarius TaxID=197179 RepID=UPI0029586AE3|nr:polygalacturonase-like [Cylas formicarius]
MMLKTREIVLLVFMLSPAAPASAADSTLTELSQVQDIVSNCTDIVVQDLTVPGGESLELDLQTGDQLKVEGLAGHVIDGRGKFYFDGQGGGSLSAKPEFLSIAEVQNSTFSRINILDCPISCVSVVSSNDVVLDEFTVDASAVSENQGDCVVVNQGGNYTLQELVCEAGEGLSFLFGFGNISISQNNTGGNVTVENSAILNSKSGLRIKNIPGIQGSITNIVYSNITLQGITNFGINIERNNADNGVEPADNIPIKKLKRNSVTSIMAGTSSIMDVNVKCSSGCTITWNWDGGVGNH